MKTGSIVVGWCGIGIAAGIICLATGAIDPHSATLHPFIRSIVYPNQDPMAGLLFDPLAVTVFFGLIGLLIGSVSVLVRCVCQRKDRTT